MRRYLLLLIIGGLLLISFGCSTSIPPSQEVPVNADNTSEIKENTIEVGSHNKVYIDFGMGSAVSRVNRFIKERPQIEVVSITIIPDGEGLIYIVLVYKE